MPCRRYPSSLFGGTHVQTHPHLRRRHDRPRRPGARRPRGGQPGRRVEPDAPPRRPPARRPTRHDPPDATPPAYTTTGEAGDFSPPPPALATPALTQWGDVTPFVLPAGSELRPPAPPEIDNTGYLAALHEVESLGSATSTARTADQTQ